MCGPSCAALGAAFAVPDPYRAERKATARTTIQATITREATAPAMILAFSLKLVGRSMLAVSGRCLRSGTRSYQRRMKKGSEAQRAQMRPIASAAKDLIAPLNRAEVEPR
jgi:hypothetical protein